MWDIKKLLIITVLMIALDSIYISIIMKTFSEQIIKIQRVVMTIRPEGAILCYFALVFGLYYFIIQPKKSPMDAFLLGLVIYAVYESTNYATLKKWSPYLVVVDTLWGGILFGTTTYLTYALT
jgi:uncharacterized membrane protein